MGSDFDVSKISIEGLTHSDVSNYGLDDKHLVKHSVVIRTDRSKGSMLDDNFVNFSTL